MNNCKICDSNIEKIFSHKILNKYDIDYYRCSNCEFIQTQDPYWLDEAYLEPLNDYDTGVMERNLLFAERASFIINKYFNPNKVFLDYAGGYGIFVRLMRDRGYDFYWTDLKAKNLFARGFEYDENKPIELITSFESIEHFDSPLETLKKIIKISPNLLFSTSLYSGDIPEEKWHYWGFEHGQHIGFYTLKTLNILAKKLNLNLYSNNNNLHLLVQKALDAPSNTLAIRDESSLNKIINYLLFKREVNKFSSKTKSDQIFLKSRTLKSKKSLVFVDLDFHEKSKSADFLRNIFKNQYEISNVWVSKSQLSNDFDYEYFNSFDLIFFFQVLPSAFNLTKIRIPIFWAPMWDDVVWKPDSFWKDIFLTKLNIVAFSNAVESKSKQFGINSIKIQAFPDINKLKISKEKGNKIFFWQRADLNFKHIMPFLDPYEIDSTTLYLTPDPGFEKYIPNKEEMSKYKIKLIDGDFTDRERYLELISKCTIYISPRLFEGIGWSFLEAMGMGLAIIAVDNSTMNEYIVNNENGYLINTNDIGKINLKNLKKIRLNSRKTIERGCKKWEEEQKQLLEFLKTNYTGRSKAPYSKPSIMFRLKRILETYVINKKRKYYLRQFK